MMPPMVRTTTSPSPKTGAFSEPRDGRPGSISRRALIAAGGAALAVSAIIVPAPASSAPKARLWERWTAHDPSSTDTVDHGAWDHLLARYLRESEDGINRFAYRDVTALDRALLEDYIARLTRLHVSTFGRPEQYAYWVNLYNATTVSLILSHYPVDSILDIDISPGLFRFGPWDAKLLAVEDEELTLNDIEHRILRPIWQDPRTHYALSCAALGCPNLAPHSFTAANTDALLESGARAYVNHKRGLEYRNGDLIVSKIYDWFREDFGGSEEGVIAHLRRYAAGDLARRLGRVNGIVRYRYDWTLNDAANDRGTQAKAASQ